MDFGVSDEDQLIGESLAAFAKDELRPALRTAEADRTVAATARDAFARMGFEGLDLPEAAGGAGLGMLTRVRVNLTLAKSDAGAAIALDRTGPAAAVLTAFGGAEAAARYLGPMLEDPAARAVLVIEAQDRAAGARISGDVAWAPTDRADLVVGLGPTSAWVLDGAGLCEPVRGAGLTAAGASRVRFDGAAAEQWTDAGAAEQALARARLYYAALLTGVLYDATESSRAYARERVAYGQPIAHHQGLAFLIVDMFTAVEGCRMLIEDAARRIDAGEDARQEAAAAFVEAVEASRFVGPNGVQILGGHGFMRDFPLEKAMRESRALGLLAGGVGRARDDAVRFATDAVFEGVW